MKTYTIGVWEEQSGYIKVIAKDKITAMREAMALLNEYGIDDMPKKYKLEVTHRDTQLV